MMSLTDASGDHVPQVPQHGHERKRVVVCTQTRFDMFMCFCVWYGTYIYKLVCDVHLLLTLICNCKLCILHVFLFL